MISPPPISTLFPYTTLFRSLRELKIAVNMIGYEYNNSPAARALGARGVVGLTGFPTDRKSTRLNSSHVAISYAVFCLKKKKKEDLTSKEQRTYAPRSL